MKRNTHTLDSFFKPQQKKTNIHVENEDVPVKKILSKKSVASPQPLNAPGDNTSNIDKSIKDSEIYVDDISLFTNTSKSLTNEEKLKVLKHIWVPPNNFTFPVIENKKRKLKFQSSWMNLFPWLAYSKIRQGGYCKYCVAFSKYGGIGNQPLGQLVVNPFIKYKDALQDFRAHSKKKYHIEAVLDAENFLDVFEKRKLPIIQQIDNDRVIQIQENRKRLVPIIQCILLCGREDISLRGHRDHGQIDISDDKCNEGNFRAILKYRAKGDDYLKTVLEGPGKRNKYISPGIQNQIIEACNKIILKKIVDKINMSECFSVLADETTDISTTEQLSICVRYVDSKNILNESFLQFFSIHSLTGKDLATSILRGLSDCGLNCEFMYGQGYDGASNMAGEFRGVQKIINDQFPRALYVHCSAHSLNLAVSSSSNIRPIRNCLGIVEKLHVFFNTPKRNNVLQNEIEKADHTPNVTTLKRLCATRWMQRYDALNDFCELYPYVVKSLSYIASEWKDTSATDACMLLKNIQDSEFMVSLYVTKVLFSYGLPICKQLQKEKIDLKKTIDLIENVISVLTDMREASEKEFKLIFNEVKERLNGLALLSVHRTIDININEVIDELATKQRKFDFVL
ncbi:zinc finger MYM-type protein 1-like isoform X5 [Melanaphis sacchari]|uniref:zinc finger MYM-type protein 1-like isoform X5 n=1 Tax=Melanaphis sacchari TaxID=742174 RepID=UPI000DC15794|nr:zinc finger MYM-type protein 1-like isoform X5 [Melanaphis sacchari]